MAAHRLVRPLFVIMGSLLLLVACTDRSAVAEPPVTDHDGVAKSIVRTTTAQVATNADQPPVTSPSPGQTDGNLIRNPGFEAGLTEWHSTRFINPADRATFDVTDRRSVGGARSAAKPTATRSSLRAFAQSSIIQMERTSATSCMTVFSSASHFAPQPKGSEISLRHLNSMNYGTVWWTS